MTSAQARLFRLKQAFWRGVKRAARRRVIVNMRRGYAGLKQRRSYERMLRSLAAGAPYHETATREALAGKQGARRPVFGADGRPCVVCFGGEDWEPYGFYQAFAAVGAFHFFSIPRLEREHGALPRGPRARRKLAAACLASIDALPDAPSVAFLYSDSNALAPELLDGLAARGIWSVVLGLDDKHRFFARRESGMRVGQETLVPQVDLLWTNWPNGAQVIAQQGGTPWFAPQGAGPQFHAPADTRRDIPILFMGQKYGIREALVTYLRRQGLAVQAAGHGWPGGMLTFAESVALINRAEVVLGNGATGCMPDVTCLKGRDFEAPMCGAAYVTTYNPELTQCYEVGRDILCYNSFVDAAEVLHGLLQAPPGVRQSLRDRARKRALRDHTWEARLRSMFQLFPS